MKKNNAPLIKCLLGVLIVLIPVVLWMGLASNNISTAGSPLSSPYSFFRFLESMIGIHSQNNPVQGPQGNIPSNPTGAGKPGSSGTNKRTLNSMPAAGTSGLQGSGQQENSGQNNPGIYTESNTENDLGVNADNGSVIDREISLENNSQVNADNTTGMSSQLNSENSSEINAENTSESNTETGSGSNTNDNTSDNSADNSTNDSSNNSGSSSGGGSGSNSGAGSCVPGCYPGCVPGCDAECDSACFTTLNGGGSGYGSGNSGNGSGNSQPNLPVLSPIPSDALVTQSIAAINQQRAQLAALMAANQALAAQAQEAAKYEISDPSKAVPPDSTPASQDIVDKIKSAQLIQH